MIRSTLTFEKVEKYLLILLLSFPLFDYMLRHWIHFGGGLWDKATLLTLVGFALVKKIMKERPESGTKAPFVAFIILGITYTVMDMPYFAASFEGFRATYQFMIAFFIGYYIFEYKSEWVTALRFLMGIGLIIALYGLLQPYLGVPMPAGWIDAGEDRLYRSFSIVQSPNVLGSYMALLIPISIALFFAEGNRKWKFVWVFVTLVLLACLLSTYSRGAWLGFAGAMAVFAILIDKRFLIAFIIGGLLVISLVPAVSERITYLFSDTYMEKSAKDGRIARWGKALDQVRNEPFFGKGLGHYGGAVADRHFNITYVDNYYAKTAAEIGLVGLTLFLWLILSILKKLYHRMGALANLPDRRWLMRGIFTGLVAVLLHNGVENIFEVPFMNTYFWFLAGSVLAVPHLIERREVEHE